MQDWQAFHGIDYDPDLLKIAAINIFIRGDKLGNVACINGLRAPLLPTNSSHLPKNLYRGSIRCIALQHNSIQVWITSPGRVRKAENL